MPNLTFFGCMLTAATSYAIHLKNASDEMCLAQTPLDGKKPQYECELWASLPTSANCCSFIIPEGTGFTNTDKCLDANGKKNETFQEDSWGKIDPYSVQGFKCGANVELSHGCDEMDFKKKNQKMHQEPKRQDKNGEGNCLGDITFMVEQVTIDPKFDNYDDWSKADIMVTC